MVATGAAGLPRYNACTSTHILATCHGVIIPDRGLPRPGCNVRPTSRPTGP